MQDYNPFLNRVGEGDSLNCIMQDYNIDCLNAGMDLTFVFKLHNARLQSHLLDLKALFLHRLNCIMQDYNYLTEDETKFVIEFKLHNARLQFIKQIVIQFINLMFKLHNARLQYK